MDFGGDCGTATGTVGVVVMMVTAVARVAALIRIKLFNCVYGGGICGFGWVLMSVVVMVGYCDYRRNGPAQGENGFSLFRQPLRRPS